MASVCQVSSLSARQQEFHVFGHEKVIKQNVHTDLIRDLEKQPSQRKLSSKDVIVETIAVDEKNVEDITGIDTASLAELRGVLRELVSITKFLDEA